MTPSADAIHRSAIYVGGREYSGRAGDHVLILTSLARSNQHGYGIISDVEQISDRRGKLDAGTLCTALDRLTNEGLIEIDREEIIESCLRRYYRLTAASASRLAEEAQRMRTNADTGDGGTEDQSNRWDGSGMTRSDRLERRYRRLLALYPKAFRQRRAEEMAAVLMAGAHEGQHWPRVEETMNLIDHAAAARLREAPGPGAFAERHPRGVILTRVLVGVFLLALSAFFCTYTWWGLLMLIAVAAHAYLGLRTLVYLQDAPAQT